mgnify:CR=1 FL=1
MLLREEYQTKNATLEAIAREAKIKPSFSSNFPDNISGFFNTSTKTGEVNKELPSAYQGFVFYHEFAHAHGTDGTPRGEYLADAEAAEKTARPEYIRGPFYSPPICLK